MAEGLARKPRGQGVARTREAAALYARMANRGAGSLAAQYLLVGSPPSEALHNRAMEAQCLSTVAVAEVNRGELAASVSAGRAALKTIVEQRLSRRP